VGEECQRFCGELCSGGRRWDRRWVPGKKCGLTGDAGAHGELPLARGVLYRGAPRPLFARAMTIANMEVVGKEGDGRWEKMGIIF
jgi:hypothetical protein